MTHPPPYRAAGQLSWRLLVIGSLTCACAGPPKNPAEGHAVDHVVDDGYALWLPYRAVKNEARLVEYRQAISAAIVPGGSSTAGIIRDELKRGLRGLLGEVLPVDSTGNFGNVIIAVTPRSFAAAGMSEDREKLRALGPEGFAIVRRKVGERACIVIAANEEFGLLYGVFHLLRLLQMEWPVDRLEVTSAPRIQYRLLDHWDNSDGTIERGYAGKSLWKWDELPDSISPRLIDYARALASIGINGTVLNNVNANPAFLTERTLIKVAALANTFRPYGIRVFLSANFASPTSRRFEQEGNRKGGIGDLETADPLDPRVREWWKKKAGEIYHLIPDFGGFLVKASSEGMPGPQEYGRSHSDGANMLAEALAPFHGIVMWRAFVYDPAIDPDRIKRAYKEFVPLDGSFAPNVFVQAKNGPLDFQPREPVQPLFGAMPRSSLMLELQITQEYLGHSTHLVYLAPMWKEILRFDTYAKGEGSPLATMVDGTRQARRMTGIAGVANTGDDRNWCGHPIAQANWYAFGRLAWDHSLGAEEIAEEWIRMTYGNDSTLVRTLRSIMTGSWEACVNYMTPLGLHHIMQPDFHYGPGPGHDTGRVDWRSTYYHRADANGIGFDRSTSGSGAVRQYPAPLARMFDDIRSCPEKYLLWFHHVPWGHRMQSGQTLWEELCSRYTRGTEAVDTMLARWLTLREKVNPELFTTVRKKLETQVTDARIWRDTCLEYFQRFSNRSAPGVHPVGENAQPDSVRLREAFANRFLIGAALNDDLVSGRDPRAAELVIRHCNTVTAENAMKWEHIHPTLREYAFDGADRFVAFGEKHRMFIVGHALVWHDQIPDLMFRDTAGALLGRESMLGRMKEHIATVVGRYRGKVGGWDVVNEALEDDGTLRKSRWTETVGEDFIARAFEYAHEADPGAELYYNDFSLDKPAKRDAVVQLVKDLKARNLRIDGVGIQGHWGMDYPTSENLDAFITALAALGVKVMVTELDLDILPVATDYQGADVHLKVESRKELDPYAGGLPDAEQKRLADRYGELFSILCKQPGAVQRVTFWGVTDKTSWLNNWPVRGRTSYPLLFDRNYQPKPAFQAILKCAEGGK